MPKALSAMEQLEAAYTDFIRLEKSRKVRKAKEDGEDDTPADPDNQKQYDTKAAKEEDDREEMDEQYGDHEPQDEADEEAEGKAAKREKRVYGEDGDDAKKSRRTRKSRRGRDEEEDIQDKDDDKDNDEDGDDLVKCKGCGTKVEKSQKFCHNCGDKLKKSKTSATKAIRDSQDSYLRDGDEDDDDIHGDAEDMGEEEGKGDDETIITNMGRRTRPGVKKSLREDFYGDLIKSTGFDADFFDANPAVERMSDIVGDYLDASERRVASLTKSLNALAKSQAAILRANTQLQQQIDQINAQPADLPQTGYGFGWNAQVDDLAKSQAAKNKNEQKSKLTKSLVREKLHKGMVNEVVESHVLSDFDNYMAKGYDPAQWVVDSLTDEQRRTLGL